MKIFVNVLSVLRIVGAFALAPLLLEQMFMWAFVVFVAAALTDWLDGFLARRFNAVSKLGGVLDHMGDKFLICIALIMMVMFLQIWPVIIPAIIMICRDLYVSGLRESAGAEKMELPVARGGKIKTVLQMLALSAMFLWIWAVNADWDSEFLTHDLLFVGIGALWLAMVSSLVSAGEYTVSFAKGLKKIKK